MPYAILKDRVFLREYETYAEAYEFVLTRKREDFRHGHIGSCWEIKRDGRRVDTREPYPLRGSYKLPEVPA